jgi:hypothetical protein
MLIISQVQSEDQIRAAQELLREYINWWESPRFQAVCVAWSWFRQSGVVSSRPPAGNASR